MVRQASNISGVVEVWESLFAELLLTVSAHQHPLRWDALEAGMAGYRTIESRMSPELRERLAELGLSGRRCAVWGTLTLWAWEHRLSDVGAALVAMESADDDQVDAWQVGLPEAERRPAAWLRDRLADAVEWWRRDILAPDEERIAGILHRDAEAKRTLASRLPAEEIVELATNGMVWRPGPGAERAVLVPSVAMRPWTEHECAGGTVLFAYPADDHPEADPEAARTQRIIRLSRVLADESRVSALRLLAEREWTLQELADELGLRKSTMHHHLAHLRAAGLLRVPFGTKSYTLRRQPLAELGAALGEFGRDR